jgi:lipid-A-disaccharide synthase-like uncharacterized protein
VIRKIGSRLLLVLSAGYILMYFSEHLFWARFRPGIDGPANYLSTWIAYCLAGYAVLAVLSVFRVRRAAAVFLTGAVFGWLVEGVIVGTTYEALPLSISFTGLAWHATLSVGIGFWLIPILLSRRKIFLLPMAIMIGFFFGAWGINWNANETEYHASIPEFILFAAVTTGLLILAYSIFTAVRRAPVRIHPAEGALLALLAALFFSFRVSAQPVAACVLPVLMGITFLALGWNRRWESKEGLLAEPLAPTTAWGLAAFLLIPLAAAGVYAPAVRIGLKIQTNVLFYLLLTPLGFILYFVSLLRIWITAPAISKDRHARVPLAGIRE